MSEPQLTSETADSADEFSMVRFMLRELPYVAALGLALVGVAYTNFTGQQINGFWEFLAVAMGLWSAW
jgi:hypothetical protein